jgi:hypothetical protein
MARLPADEDYARALLSILQAKNIRARQSMRIGEAKDAFVRHNMGRPFDFDAALEYAESQNWLRVGFGAIRLTGVGDEEMHTVAGFYPGDGLPQGSLAGILARFLAGKLVRSRGLEPPLRLKN